MPLNLKHPAAALFSTCLVGIGAVAAGPLGLGIVGGVVIGVGTEHFAHLADEGWRRFAAGRFDRTNTLNHDLQLALQRGFKGAITSLELSWFNTTRGHQQRRDKTDASAIAAFQQLRDETEQILSPTWLDQLAADADQFRTLRETGADAAPILAQILDSYLISEDPQLVDFIKKNLLNQIAASVVEELKQDNRESKRAWRAFQILTLDSLQTGQRAALDALALNQTQLAALDERLKTLHILLTETLPPDQRDPTGQAELIRAIGPLLDKIAAESGLTRDFIARSTAVVIQVQRASAAEITDILGGKIDMLDGKMDIGLQKIYRLLLLILEREQRDVDGSRPARLINLPHHNPHFTGRETHLAQIETIFAESDRPAALVQAIQGLGGVGKSQLAIHYAYTHQHDYAGIIWLSADTPTALAAQYAALATEFHLTQAETADQAVVVAAFRNHLETTPGPWLLIFDNAHTPADLDAYRPRAGQVDVIITSREQVWDEIADPLDVDVLSSDEARDFLLQRTSDPDPEAAVALAAALGYLPLALEQAGAFIRENRKRVTLRSYLDRHGADLMRTLATHRPKTGAYQETIATTWSISFAAVEATAPAAADLLRLCSYFAPDAIPLDVISAHPIFLPPRLVDSLSDLDGTDTVLAILSRYSLITITDESTFSIHRLVQLVTRDLLEADGTSASWVESAVSIVDAAFPFESDDIREWPACARLLSHGLASSDFAERLDPVPAAADRLLNQIGIYFQSRAQLLEAKRALRRSLAIREATYGPNHPSVATPLGNLALLLQEEHDLAAARPLFERSLTINEAAYGSTHPDVAIDLGNLASLLKDQGDLAAARPLYERSLAIMKAAHGENHPYVATVLSNLAGLLSEQGDLAAARPLYERSLAIDEAAYGPAHPSVATALGNLAWLLREQGDLAAVRPLYKRSLRIYQAFERRYREGVTFYNLASLALSMGRPVGALQLFAVTWLIHSEIGHPDAEQHARTVAGLAECLGLSEDEYSSLLPTVETAYRADRGWRLIDAAFDDPPDAEVPT